MWALRQTSPAKIIDGNWAYLIEGPERAALIDNGYGIGDLKGLCEFLVGGKEVLSLVSHCHLDHANGSHQWAEIYCHQFCADNLVKKQKEGQNHFRDSAWYRECRRAIVRDEDLVERRKYRCIGLKDHALINLGADYDVVFSSISGLGIPNFGG